MIHDVEHSYVTAGKEITSVPISFCGSVSLSKEFRRDLRAYRFTLCADGFERSFVSEDDLYLDVFGDKFVEEFFQMREATS